MECIRRNIAVYCPHTSLDCAADGINEFLALGLGDGTTRKITEKGGAGQKGAGEGAIRTLDQPVPVEDLIERVKNHLSLKTGKSILNPFDAQSFNTRIKSCWREVARSPFKQ